LRVEGATAPIQLNIRPDWTQTLTAIAGIVSVLLVAAGLFYTNDANRKQQDANRAQQEVNRAQQALAEQGQVTERFSRAIEQLGQEGADKLGVRLGAIYALERLMRDSPDDGSAIVDVLSAFIRSHATRRPETGSRAASVPRSPEDVRTAFTAVARRPAYLRGMIPDLSGVNLGLPALVLRDAELDGVDLGGVDLTSAHLGGARLRGANLQGASLSEARLQSADLSGANLAFADLSGADLGAVDFDWLGWSGRRGPLGGPAKLVEADLAGANMFGARLAEADLLLVGGLSSEMLRCAFTEGAKLPPPFVARSRADVVSDPSCKR
jgi:hypothetical protein